MRAQRIKTVFRRIGLAVVCGVADVLMMGLGACSYHAGHGHDYVVATSAGMTSPPRSWLESSFTASLRTASSKASVVKA